MPSWWKKSSSKDANKKSEKGSLINTIHKKFRIVSEGKCNNGSGSSGKQHCDAKHASCSPISPSTQVSRCGSFAERPQALPLPLPGLQQTTKHRADSANKEAAKAESSEGSKPFMFLPLPKPPNVPDKSMDNETPSDSRLPSPQASGYKNGKKAAMKSPSSANLPMLGSGHCSGPDSGHNSGQILVGGDFAGQLFWEYSRCSHVCSPLRSPRMTSPGPSSRIHSGAVTPLQYPPTGRAIELPAQWPDGEHQRHWLPLPPINISNTYPSYSPETTPVPRSPSRAENPSSHGFCWKKGKLLGRGTYGQVYVGFDRENGEMCAMKKVTLFSDDAKSKESAQQLKQEIALLSRLQHPNIVQYFGSEVVDDKLYIYLEYVSGGSIYKLLQDYGQLGEAAIRSYTQQILSGIAYLHARRRIHRDIKGANLLVYPNGRVKLADFGMAKHISGQSGPLSFKGSPYWMAPEIIVKNIDGCNLAVDIWSLGCTVLEMATTKPPWSQFEGAAAIFKIGHTEELPELPQYLSDDGKDFIRRCLQRNPIDRPSAAQLLGRSLGNQAHYHSREALTGWRQRYTKDLYFVQIIVKNIDGCNLAVDIWSLGCTVLEMATTKPPWSQFEGAAAIFKIGHTEELPELPQYLSDDGKDFIRRCLQRNPIDRPSAAQLLGHPFVINAALPERPLPCLEPAEIMSSVEDYWSARKTRAATKHTSGLNLFSGSSDLYVPRNVPSTFSQNTSSLLHPRSPRHMSPRPCASPISSPHDISGSSTPLTGGGGPRRMIPRPCAYPILSPPDISGSSTPLTGGGGTIPIHIAKQPPINSHEGMGITPRSPKVFNYQNAMSYKELKPDAYLGPLKAYHIYQETVQAKKDFSSGGV